MARDLRYVDYHYSGRSSGRDGSGGAGGGASCNQRCGARLLRELRAMGRGAAVGADATIVDAAPYDADCDVQRWYARLRGPAGTPYAGITLTLDVYFPDAYPLAPPLVRFATPVFHPNVHPRGHVCLDILDTEWSPALTLEHVLLSIASLLADANAADPYNAVAAHFYVHDRAQFNAMARQAALRAGAVGGACGAIAADETTDRARTQTGRNYDGCT